MKHFAGAILAWTVFVAVKTTEAYCRVCPLAPFANVYAWTVQSGMGDCSGGVSRSLQNTPDWESDRTSA
jgi:hypothetical protein